MTAEAPRPRIIDEIKAEIEAQKVEQTLTEEEMARRQALAEGLFELCEDQNFLGLILRRDTMARSEVEVFLFDGGRDDLDSMYFGEELVLRVNRQGYAGGLLGVLVARQLCPNVTFLFGGGRLPKGKALEVKNRAERFFGAEYQTVAVSEWLSGDNYEVALERRVQSAEELLKTHGSRIDEIMETLKAKVRRG